MSSQPPGLLRTLKLLVGLTWRRFVNRLTWSLAQGRKGKKSSKPKKAKDRVATGRRISTGAIWIMFLFPCAVLQIGGMMMMQMHRLRTVAEQPPGEIPRVIRLRSYSYQQVVEAHSTLQSPPTFETERKRSKWRKKVLSDLRDHIHLERTTRKQASPAETERRLDAVIDLLQSNGLERFKETHNGGFLDWVDPVGEEPFLAGLSIILIMLFGAVTLMALGSSNEDLGRFDRSLEWLFSFPVSTHDLMFAKLLEYAVVAPAGWMIFVPTLTVIHCVAGWNFFAAAGIAILQAATILLMLASVRLTVESWLRGRLPLSRMKNVQAMCTLASVLSMFAILYLSIGPSIPHYFARAMESAPQWVRYLPPTLPLAIDSIGMAGKLAPVGWNLALMGCIAALFMIVALRVTVASMKHGVITSSSPHQGERLAKRLSRAGADGTAGSSRSGVVGVVGKELRLLLRDRNFMVQTMIVPVLLIGWNLVIHPELMNSMGADPRHAAATAFGIGAYVLMFGAMGLMASEGRALWLLYTLPQPLEVLLRRKVVVWGCVAATYTLTVLVLFSPSGAWRELDWIIGGGMAVAGVAIYSLIAGGMGMLGWNPDMVGTARRVRPGAAYSYMFLASIYAYGIYGGGAWNRVVVLILSSLLASAIWEKVRDQIPLILDPTAAPPKQIVLADGVVATYSFFVLQGVIGIALQAFRSDGSLMLHSTIAFIIAGFLVSMGVMAGFSRRNVEFLPEQLGLSGANAGRSILGSVTVGAMLGAVVGLLGLVYVHLVKVSPIFESLREGLLGSPFEAWQDRVAYAVLAIVAAPLIEELLFRGVVFAGLRRGLSTVASVVVCAALFAVVHPVHSVIPVFVMGLCATALRAWGGTLAGPVILHAVYNSIIVAGQM